MTEHLTDSDTFQPNGGGIDIVDDTGGSALENAATAHFLVFSNGANGDGAYTIDGVRTPCAATDAEAQNCELSTDAVYSALQANTEGGDDNYDDVMTFFTEKDLPLWQMSAVANQEDHAHVKNPGKVGFGVDGEAEVRQELQIGDVLRVQDNPDTGPTEGQVKIENLCDYDANNGDCFAPSKIGGQIAQGEGMPCPAGQFLKAIQNSAAVCEDEIIVRCPPGNYMTGIDDDGEPVCNVPPPLGCGQQNVNLTCGADTFTRSIGPSRNGERQTVRAGFSLSRTFECRNGNWIEIGSQSGLCACIPDTTSRRVDTQNCAVPASNCGNRFSGTRDVQSQFQCPAASWANVVIRNGCQCEETFRDTSGSCPAGFNRGSIFYRNTHICTGTPRCSGNVETSRTCACEPDRREERRWCDNGYSGRYWVESFFTCGAGANQPGSWSDWTEKAGETRADRCTCDARQLSDQFADCPEGYEGRIVIKSERICENGVPRVVETRRINECRVIEPMRCKWNDQGSVVSSGRSPKQYMDEQSCNCGVDQPTLCSKAAGNNGYDHYFCSCGQ